MRVRPPQRHRRHAELAGRLARLDRERGAVRPGRTVELDRDAGHRRLAERAQHGTHRQHPGLALDARPQGHRVERDPAPALQRHPPPRPDGGGLRREPGRAAEQHRPHEAQTAVGDDSRSPARPRTAWSVEQRAQRAAADRELVRGSQPLGDRHQVPGEHRVAADQQLAVQVDLRDGREAVEAQHELLAGLGGPGREARAEPPVLVVQPAPVAEAPPAGRAQRTRRRAGHARGEPIEPGERARVRVCGRRTGRRRPTGLDRAPLESAARRRLSRGHDRGGSSPHPRRPTGSRAPRSDRTAGAARA